jgi:hypothetical protein
MGFSFCFVVVVVVFVVVVVVVVVRLDVSQIRLFSEFKNPVPLRRSQQ